MEFFEKLGKKASETYKTATEKTNKIASDTKLKLKISENKSKIDDIYTEIGKKVYQKFVLDGDLNIKDDIKEELEKIKQLTNEIEDYEKQRLELSDMRQCPNCKSKIDREARFCPKCGTEQPETKEEIEVEVILENETSQDAENSVQVTSEENAENVSEDTNKIVEDVVLDDGESGKNGE